MSPPHAIRSRPAQNLIPRGAALGRGNSDAAGKLKEVRRLGNYGTRLLDPEQQLVPLA